MMMLMAGWSSKPSTSAFLRLKNGVPASRFIQHHTAQRSNKLRMLLSSPGTIDMTSSAGASSSPSSLLIRSISASSSVLARKDEGARGGRGTRVGRLIKLASTTSAKEPEILSDFAGGSAGEGGGGDDDGGAGGRMMMNGGDGGGSDKIVPIELNTELSTSFMQYAMSTILGRALPDARDGLKPVHRRILYAMHVLNLQPESSYRKCARVVGEVLGKLKDDIGLDLICRSKHHHDDHHIVSSLCLCLR